MKSLLLQLLVLLLVVMVSLAEYSPVEQGSPIATHLNRIKNKKSFSSIGCLGTYDKSKFARLDRVCDECYQIYRNPEIHNTCREFCFKNEVFPACVDALLLQKEQKELGVIVDELLG